MKELINIPVPFQTFNDLSEFCDGRRSTEEFAEVAGRAISEWIALQMMPQPTVMIRCKVATNGNHFSCRPARRFASRSGARFITPLLMATTSVITARKYRQHNW